MAGCNLCSFNNEVYNCYIFGKSAIFDLLRIEITSFQIGHVWASDPAEVDGNKTIANGRAMSTVPYYCEKNQNGPIGCSEDCEYMHFCMNGRMTYINCLAQTGKKYCDIETNTCSDTINTCYNSRDFCPSAGEYYPDLTNCHRYVYCDEDRVYPYECEFNTVYDFKTKACVQDAQCSTFTWNSGCKNNLYGGILVKHPNPRWFVFCNWGKPLLGECPKYLSFDPEAGLCRFQCEQLDYPSNGNYPNYYDASTYYSCVKIGNKWMTKFVKCPPGASFNEYTGVCQ